MRILKKYSIEAGLSPSFKMAEEKQLQEVYDNVIKRIRYGEIHTVKNLETISAQAGFSPSVLEIETIAKLAKISDLESIFEDIFLVIKKIKALGLTPSEFLKNSRTAIENYSKIVATTPFKFESKEEYAQNWAEHYRSYIDDYCVFDEKVFDSIAKEKLILDKNNKKKAIEYGMAQGFPENIPEITQTELLLNEIICGIYAIYQAELERLDIADFDDLINKTIQIFKENELIRAHYQDYFKHVIVDEFQDTNGAQLELIELLLNPKHADLTFVGDRKQSIYAFRYAQMENLEVLHQEVEKRYAKRFEPINLSINYRSTPEVLHAVNFVTENELKLNEALRANPYKDFPDTKKDIKVTVLDGFDNAFDQKTAEAAYIAQEIERLKARDNADYKDFSILVKSHYQSDIVEKELKKKNIPSVKKVNTGFFKEPVIKNVLSAFRLVKNSEDEQALLRLLKTEFCNAWIFRLKKALDKALFEILEIDKLKNLNLAQKFITLSVAGKLPETPETEAVKKIYETINYVRKNKSTMTLMQILEKFKNELVFVSVKNEFEQIQAQNNVKIFEKIIDDFTQNENYISVNSLLDYFEKIAQDRNFELPSVKSEDLDAVQILTIHASKGLEFKYVFVLSISNSSKPEKSNILFDMQYGEKSGFGVMISKLDGKSSPKTLIYKNLWQKPRTENENLRLFYVAVSRAKNYLNVLSFEPYSKQAPVGYISSLGEFLGVQKDE